MTIFFLMASLNIVSSSCWLCDRSFEAYYFKKVKF